MNSSTFTIRGLGNYILGHFCSTSLFAKAFSIMLFLVFIIHFNGSAQAGLAGNHPSCNISGALESVASGTDITVNIEVAHSTPNPKLSYEFSNNTSNAFIRSKGPIVYNAANNSATQQIVVSPGSTGTGFNLKLEVSTPAGISSCSKSVSVTPVSGGSSGKGSSGGSSTPGH
jgi:hypothetical protein